MQLGRDLHQDVDMIGHCVSLDELDVLAEAELLEDLSDVCSEFPVYLFPSIFRDKYDMVLTVPPRM